jgi:hypothetical protein
MLQNLLLIVTNDLIKMSYLDFVDNLFHDFDSKNTIIHRFKTCQSINILLKREYQVRILILQIN